MSTSMTLMEFRTAVRQRSNQDNASGDYSNSFIKDDELNSYINQSAFELYDILIQSYGNDYFVADPYLVTTDGTSDSYPLPSDFYKIINASVQALGSGGAYVPMRQGSVSDMVALSGIRNVSTSGTSRMLYRLRANKLWLSPLPQNGQVIQVLFVPRFETMTSDSDSFDGISGWTEYVIVDAAIKCMQKEESDVSVLVAQKTALLVRIQSAAVNRDAGAPATVTDSASNSCSRIGFFDGGFV